MRKDSRLLGEPANIYDEELTGVCGKSCVECALFYRQTKDDSTLRDKVSEYLGIQVSANELTCEGCSSLKRFVHVSECPICFCCNDHAKTNCKECRECTSCEMKQEILESISFLKELGS